MATEAVVKALGVTAEVMGAELSPSALRVMADDLSSFPVAAVLDAIQRTRRECPRLTIAAVIERVDDGRPGPEEAWGMVPRDEESTAVWTEEMRLAHGAASTAIAEGDMVAARVAFLESYRREIAKAKANGTPVRWHISLGFDPAGREAALVVAVERGRLSADRALARLPQSDTLRKMATRDALPGPNGDARATRQMQGAT